MQAILLVARQARLLFDRFFAQKTLPTSQKMNSHHKTRGMGGKVGYQPSLHIKLNLYFQVLLTRWQRFFRKKLQKMEVVGVPHSEKTKMGSVCQRCK